MKKEHGNPRFRPVYEEREAEPESYIVQLMNKHFPEGLPKDNDPEHPFFEYLRPRPKRKPVKGDFLHVRNGQTKLKKSEVFAICEMLDSGEHVIVNIAEEFNISPASVSMINSGSNWGWLTGRGKIGIK